MARTYTGPALTVQDAAGNVLANRMYTVWTAPDGLGTQITALKDRNGNALPGYILSDAQGGLYARVDADTWPVVWFRGPDGKYTPVVALEVSQQVGDALAQFPTILTATEQAIEDAETARTTAEAADNRSQQALTAAQQASDQVNEAIALVGGAAATVDQLPAPVYIAHRGGAALGPENTLDAMRAMHAIAPATPLEMDVWATRDGGTIVMHDTTITRTTSSSGNTADQTAASGRILRVDAGNWFANQWPNDIRVPTFPEVVREFGGRTVLIPEAKNTGAGQLIVTALQRAGLTRAAIVQSFIQAELTPAVSAGIAAMMLANDGATLNPASLAAAGIDWVGVGTCTGAFVTACHDAGLKVVIFTVDRQTIRDSWLALGVDGFFSGDPLYLAGTHKRLTSAPLAAGTYYHGHLPGDINQTFMPAYDGKGQFGSGLILDVPAASNGQGTILQGWACPVGGNPAANTYTITATVVLESAVSSTRWPGLFFAANTDKPFNDASETGSGPTGYHVIWRQNGAMELYRYNGTTATLLASVTVTAWTTGTSRTFTIAITPTGITVTCTSLTSNNVVSANDTTYRGGWFHLTTNQARARFTAVSVA